MYYVASSYVEYLCEDKQRTLAQNKAKSPRHDLRKVVLYQIDWVLKMYCT